MKDGNQVCNERCGKGDILLFAAFIDVCVKVRRKKRVTSLCRKRGKKSKHPLLVILFGVVAAAAVVESGMRIASKGRGKGRICTWVLWLGARLWVFGLFKYDLTDFG